jgi:hypothetical protein
MRRHYFERQADAQTHHDLIKSYQHFISLHNVKREDICDAATVVLGAISTTPRSAAGLCPL